MCVCLHSLSSLGQTLTLRPLSATAAAPLVVGPIKVTTVIGQPVSGDVLAAAVPPAGSTLQASGVKIGATLTPIAAGGSFSSNVVDPGTNTTAGTLRVYANGTFTFVPNPSFLGSVPPVLVSIASSDGQTVNVTLAAGVVPPLITSSQSPSVQPGNGTVALSVLAGAVTPPGTSTNATGFTLPGSATVYPTGATAVTVIDPDTNQTAGAVVVQPDGSFTFTPAGGFTGQVPAITCLVQSSDGQLSQAVVTALIGTSGDYVDPADIAATPTGVPASGNVLSNAVVPNGVTVSITGFSVAGSTTKYPAGSNITLASPLAGSPVGQLSLRADGMYTFVPAPGYVGPSVAVDVYSSASSGDSAVSSLRFDVAGADGLEALACAHLRSRHRAECAQAHEPVAMWTVDRQDLTV